MGVKLMKYDFFNPHRYSSVDTSSHQVRHYGRYAWMKLMYTLESLMEFLNERSSIPGLG